MQRAHSQLSCAIPVLLYIITFRCFPSHFLLFLFFSTDLATDRTPRTAQYTATPLLFARTPPDKPVRSQSSHASSLRYAATSRLHTLFASCSRTFRQVRHSFCRRTAADAPSCLFRFPLFPQAVQGSAFLYVLVSCGTYVLSSAKTSMFIEVFACLCIFIHRVIACFSLMRSFLPPLRSFSPLPLRGIRSRFVAAPPLLFPSPASPPGLPFH